MRVSNPLFYDDISYASNNIDSLIVLDKNGGKVSIPNSPSIEMRITHRNGKKYILYFDTVIIEDDTLKGARSRFIQKLNLHIPMDSIGKVEVHNGRKRFIYK